jgi:hypothetical protein
MSDSFEIPHTNGRTLGQRIKAINGEYWLVTFFRTEGDGIVDVLSMKPNEVAAMLKQYGVPKKDIGRIVGE